MASLSPTPLPPPGIAQVDVLLDGGYRWVGLAAPAGATALQVHHAAAVGEEQPWEAAGIAAALGAWAAVARLAFAPAAEADAADIRILLGSVSPVDEQPPGYSPIRVDADVTAIHETPYYAGLQQVARGGLLQARGYYRTDEPEWTETGVLPGGNGFWTILHELGHALGLKHPFGEGSHGVLPEIDNPALNALYSVMDYDIGGLDPEGWYQVVPDQSVLRDGIGAPIIDHGYVRGPAALDIAAIQYLYGANTATAAGDDVYLLPDDNAPGRGWATIWDAGGVDEIRYDGSRDARITLDAFDPREALTVANAGDWISQARGVAGGFVIAGDITQALPDQGRARGVVIENATGGAGNDILRGNAAGNALHGREGADRLRGAAGNDSLDGGAGRDRLAGGKGADTLVSGGDAGRDLLSGGEGADLFVIGPGAGRDVIRGFTPGEDRIDLSETGMAGFTALLAAVRPSATDLHVRLAPGATLVLRDLGLEALSAGDFLFA